MTPVGGLILGALLVLQISGAAYLLRLFRRDSQFYKSALTADGWVSRVVHYSGGSELSYVYTYSYTVGAKVYAIEEDLATRWFRPRKGQPIRIYYLPDAPDKGRIAHPSHGPVLLIGALLCTAVSLLTVVLLIRGT
jgi:hypothetical protein